MIRNAIIHRWLKEKHREAKRFARESARIGDYGQAAVFKGQAEAYAIAALAVRPHAKEPSHGDV